MFLESIYRSPPPLVVSCRGKQDSFSFSLSRRMSHSLPAHTQARTCDGRASASVRALRRSRILYAFMYNAGGGGGHGRKIFFPVLCSSSCDASIFFLISINEQIFPAHRQECRTMIRCRSIDLKVISYWTSVLHSLDNSHDSD